MTSEGTQARRRVADGELVVGVGGEEFGYEFEAFGEGGGGEEWGYSRSRSSE